MKKKLRDTVAARAADIAIQSRPNAATHNTASNNVSAAVVGLMSIPDPDGTPSVAASNHKKAVSTATNRMPLRIMESRSLIRPGGRSGGTTQRGVSIREGGW